MKISKEAFKSQVNDFKSKLTWSELSKDEALTETFIREYQDKLNWEYISQYQTLSEDFIREFADKVDWDNISRYQNLSENFMREFQDRVNFNLAALDKKLSESFLREFVDKFNFLVLSIRQDLSEDFIKDFANELDLDEICTRKNLSEDLMRELEDKLDWAIVSRYQNLSENFIREFEDKVNWRKIGKYQNLSEKFVDEFSDRLNIKKNTEIPLQSDDVAMNNFNARKNTNGKEKYEDEQNSEEKIQCITKKEREREAKNKQGCTLHDIVDKNTEYYLKEFKKIDNGEKSKFNWAAFFFGSAFCLYRKCFNLFKKYFMVPLILLLVGTLVLSIASLCFSFSGAIVGWIISTIGNIWNLVNAVRIGKNFNKEYYEHCKMVLSSREQKQYGTSKKNVVVFIVVYICIVTILTGLSMIGSMRGMSSLLDDEEYIDGYEEEYSDDYNADDDSMESQPIKEDWKKQYIDIIETEANYDYDYGDVVEAYKLVDIDEDGIPELYIDHGIEASGYNFISYKKHNLINELLPGPITSYSKKGIILVEGGSQGMYFDKIYKLNKKGLMLESEGSRYENPDGFSGNEDDESSYVWNDEDVSYEEYTENIMKSFGGKMTGDLSKSNTYDYDSIIEAIKNY